MTIEYAVTRTKGDRRTVKLIAVGDIMFGEHPLCLGFGIDNVIDEMGPSFIFEKVAPIFKGADIVFCNLENMLLDRLDDGLDTGRFEDIYLRGAKECAGALASAGFNIVNLANNHALQHGEDGLYGTIELLDGLGIKHVGVSGRNRVVFDAGDMKIGFLGYCSDQQYMTCKRYVEPLDPGLIESDIRELKSQGVDVIVLSFHWGEEYVDAPSLEQIGLARTAIDAGADLILGHHSHVIHGIERYGKGVIAYSLGNFVGDMSWGINLVRTIIFLCEIPVDGGEIRVKAIPVVINDRFQPEPAPECVAEKILCRLDRLSAELDVLDMEKPSGKFLRYRRHVKVSRNRNRLNMYRHFILNLYRYEKGTAGRIVNFFLGRKLAKIPWVGKRQR